jgi:ubiquinone biosynthesis protein UbiJ
MMHDMACSLLRQPAGREKSAKMNAMNTAAPLQFLSDLLGAARDRLGAPRLPEWLDHEIRNRIVLVLNHVLQQHPQAQQRLREQQDKVLLAQWQQWSLRLQVTPAGLFALADETRNPHLTVQAEDADILQLARQAMWGQRPETHISGDAELAALVHWLTANVRWDGEADLARLIGPETARHATGVLRHVRQALQDFVDAMMPLAARHGGERGEPWETNGKPE